MVRIVRFAFAVLLLAVLYGIINVMGKSTLTQSSYDITSDKVTKAVRIAVIADLHNTRYGENQSRLLARVRLTAPDVVAFTGDAFHAHVNESNTLEALSRLSAEYPCYFVIGNHERTSADCLAMKAAARARGVTVLEGGCETITVNGQAVQLCGLDDYSDKSVNRMHSQLLRVSECVRPELFSVLLVHRPERFSDYLPCGFDVILAGHAHGGQWRIPGARNGLISPGQGWFPQYAGGQYSFGAQTMCVSRGLSNKPLWLARFGNPPEIMLVTINPA